jgi:hypothetical protein
LAEVIRTSFRVLNLIKVIGGLAQEHPHSLSQGKHLGQLHSRALGQLACHFGKTFQILKLYFPLPSGTFRCIGHALMHSRQKTLQLFNVQAADV